VVLLRPLYARPVFQIVLTFGLSMAVQEVVRTLYGPAGLVPVQKPAARHALPLRHRRELRARWLAWRAAHPAQTTPPADPPPATISLAPAAGDKR
jgi:hypothetical protein